MDHLLPELIRLNIPFIIIILLAFIAGIVSFWLYKRTVPPVKDSIRIVLGSLRALVVFCTALLIFNPTLYLTYIEKRMPRLGFFVDNSGSMSISGPVENRRNQVDSVVTELKRIFKDQSSRWSTFNSRTKTVTTDTIPASRAATNFEQLFKILETSDSDHNVLITDGIITEGIFNLDGLKTLTSQVHVVGIGKKEAQKDIFISNVLYQPEIYQNEMQEIIVQIANRGVSGARSVLNLSLRGQTLSSKMVQIDMPNAEQNVHFKIQSNQLGLQAYQLQLGTIEEESNSRNNTFSFAQKIIKNKIKIGILSSAPGYESKFLKLLLSRNKNYLVSGYIENRNGRFINNDTKRDFDSLDVYILEGFPGKHTSMSTIDRLISVFRKQQPGIILILNEKTNWQLFNRFQQSLSLPDIKTVRTVKDISIVLPEVAQLHPVIQIFEDAGLNETFWTNVPPIKDAYHLNLTKESCISLLNGRAANQLIPVIFNIKSPSGNTLVFNGNAFWQWHFLLQNENDYADGYQKLLSHAVRWVSYKERLRPVIINTSDDIIKLGDKIHIRGNLYDAERRPIKDGTLFLEADWEGQRFQIDVQNDSTGTYLAEFWPPGPGKYRVIGRGERNGLNLGTDDIEFEVIPFEKEFLRLEQNVVFLKHLCERNNGIYTTSDELDKLRASMDLTPKYIKHDDEIEIWYKPFLLLIIILLITLEWIVRKRSGLV